MTTDAPKRRIVTNYETMDTSEENLNYDDYISKEIERINKENKINSVTTSTIYDCPSPSKINYKYNEDKTIQEIKNYIDSTYSQHYVSNETNLQALDAWLAMGNFATTVRDTIVKYAWRLGKKDDSKKEAMKMIHYGILLLNYYNIKEKKNG